MNILLLAAFPAESARLARQLSGHWQADPLPGALSCRKLQHQNHLLWLAETGVGTEDAALTTLALLQQRQFDLILLFGTSGAVGDGWAIGDVVVGNRIVQMDLYGINTILKGTPFESCLLNANTGRQLETEWVADPYWLGRLRGVETVKEGIIFCSNQFPVPQATFPAMLAQGCGVIEMEASGVMRAARRVGAVPVVVLRAISNIVDEQGQDTGTPAHAIDLCAERLASVVQQGVLATACQQ